MSTIMQTSNEAIVSLGSAMTRESERERFETIGEAVVRMLGEDADGTACVFETKCFGQAAEYAELFPDGRANLYIPGFPERDSTIGANRDLRFVGVMRRMNTLRRSVFFDCTPDDIEDGDRAVFVDNNNVLIKTDFAVAGRIRKPKQLNHL